MIVPLRSDFAGIDAERVAMARMLFVLLVFWVERHSGHSRPGGSELG